MVRKFEKYDINVPAKIEVISPEGGECIFLQTISVSAKEVFFCTAESLPNNVMVRLELTLDFTKPEKLSSVGTTILINVTGKVVRSENVGMTILLNEDYQITKLRIPAMSGRTALAVETWY
ncbi:MAG TPA: hypothetical protein DDY17_03565 [Syntrophaceae bacterium]|nr:hypothetical protein [Syntrophaceae bacterium]